jgi:hypothetical protein
MENRIVDTVSTTARLQKSAQSRARMPLILPAGTVLEIANTRRQDFR